ncbi:MAG TPA: hypothetical protein VN181_00510, partial [Thermoanaerobaculia bacterium]|nr:hypothetical protein [Thermoanaerobaculia bacterium]
MEKEPAASIDLDALIARFRDTTVYERDFADALLRCARDASMPWHVRTTAAVMLERQLLRVDDANEEGRWLAALGCDIAFAELRARMLRLARIESIGDLLHIARRECRISIGRWLWTPAEVVKRIESLVRRSGGTPLDCAFEEGERLLPPYERAIVQRLKRGLRIRWVSDATPAEINSLIENPKGTVVLVVKPPGSTIEIEIKRAGVRGPRALDCVVARRMPRWHHLHGGSMERLLLVEARQSERFSRLYRTVHGDDAAMSRTVQVAAIGAMPDGTHPLDHFASCDPRALDAASDILGGRRQRSPSPLRAAARFLAITRPAQAIEIGTSSFRLDRLALYLSSRGADEYFGRRADRDDARRFADEILDEVLCVYEPPRVSYRTHSQYVAAAFAVPANRARASENFLSAVRQLGR